MIKKFKTVNNLAVFNGFIWDQVVKDPSGNIREFEQINILYGRNYSGKTTLSRIVRAMETGVLSEKYTNPNFSIGIKDSADVDQSSLSGHGHKIRVFNEDFVRENLRFIVNPEEGINSFAILGEDNNKVEEEIKAIELIIGSDKEGEETGLRKDALTAQEIWKTQKSAFDAVNNQLNSQLGTKATDAQVGIKYNAERFGDQNYSRPKLDRDIQTVLDTKYTLLTPDEFKRHEGMITETVKPDIPELVQHNLAISALSDRTKALVEKKVGESGKIEELVRDSVKNEWAKQGRIIHKREGEKCAFCDNEISENRWKELDKHFDEESEKLELDIKNQITQLKSEIAAVNKGFEVNINSFYARFQHSVELLQGKYVEESNKYIESLNALIDQLELRLKKILEAQVFKSVEDNSVEIQSVWTDYDTKRIESNEFTASLNSEKQESQKQLRLYEVSTFLKTINYKDEVLKIEGLNETVQTAKSKLDQINVDIDLKEKEILQKKSELNDEKKGALKVNEYLNNFFGHNFLSLDAVTEEEEEEKQTRFEVLRDGNKAHHLSEGECSLISFCYFMAKLDDIETKGSSPIIWIDDPISSLDGNHIFFLYSLVKSEIVDSGNFSQLFVSTHNLDFLKYLKRLNGGITTPDGKFRNYQKAFFIVNRRDHFSAIEVMPKYLKEYITEFNYLFEQIYKCSEIQIPDDSNYTVFYNFGNNARKFLEIFLYYKYPDDSDDLEKMKKFFGNENVPAILTERVNNEYSHLAGVFERGATPIEVPEMTSTARLIIAKIKEDQDQFNSLLKSIGVELTDETVIS